MAQAFSHDGIRSLWSQCEESKKLHFISQDKPSLVGQLNARDLSITSGSDLCHWKWSHVKDGISGDMNEVAELLEIRCLQIDGRYEANKLKQGLLYEVQYVVMLKDNHTITTPLKLVLTLPDGTKHESTKNLMEEPRNHMIGLKLGHFLTQNLGGDVKFSLVENSSAQKRGLVVIGALIVPNIV
ncbi:hypothetical protein DCAR_0104647 [Daucus carota subsp. sativus]|uniref:Uncharacterized protein n=1 Tax=Daucus carota subsp. sativus TaxID=79200 RepID=A0AAF0WBW4_DAUCS|nr:PREDICTED: putative protein PHLOEM PROTEIN 2-LIKE A3 [Daucus carota subsp. sativus]WOG85458.1 hypothetical protein DCAR_0104647 [Daucus carota subsp. sativus]